jgi:aspartyl-tRNA(Asn)/glutamyl-tRNA(Gln) amidotransferase subunit A
MSSVAPGPSQTGPFVEDPGRIEALAAAIRARSLSAEALLARCIARIGAVEPHVHAWRVVDSARALEEARRLDEEAQAGTLRGPLHGIPLAVKDVIDVAGLPTRCNSRALAERAPASADAEVVSALRAAGAVVLGKVHTTEFAFYDPSPACNPHHTGHTPGGSSSGSAAAVAAGMVPAALGTQTVASVNRPASYCGIAAFKPSTGLLSVYGVTPLAPMFDTVGFYGYRVADAVALFRAACPAHARRSGDAAAQGPLTVVALKDPVLERAAPVVGEAMAAAADALRAAGHVLHERDSEESFERLCDAQMRCARYEMARVHRGLLDLPREQVGEKLRAAIEEGALTDDGTYRALRGALASARRRLFDGLSGAHAVLWPAAPATAPEGLGWTGDPSYISPWTALGGPLVTVRVGADAAGLPVGALLAGAPGSDAGFTHTACRLADALER